jgi:outer membrane protein assembly factor BamA
MASGRATLLLEKTSLDRMGGMSTQEKSGLWRRVSAAIGVLSVMAILPQMLPRAAAQTAALKEVKCDGQKKLTEAQIATLTGLQAGAQVGKDDMQKAADRLVATGLFADVRYDFHTRGDGVSLNFHVSEAPRLAVYYDNFPWFGDSELNDAIKAQLPFFDGTLPEGGGVLDAAANGIHDLLAAHKLDLPVQHQVVANPTGEGNVQQFTVEGASLKISGLTFSDASLAANPAVQQHLAEIVGKPYSRTTLDLFLSEQIRPIYQKQGFLKVKLGPAEVRLSGAPAAKLPEQIPVYVPVAAGDAYRLGDVEWSGNNVISSISLTSYFAMKPGALADGMQMEAALDQIREEYGRRGYLEAVVQPEPAFDDGKHTVRYRVAITEGAQYHMGGWVITGLSATGESRVRTQFPIAAGDVFDKIKYEEFLTGLQEHAKEIFGELPIHYETVGHYLRADADKKTVDVLLDFK